MRRPSRPKTLRERYADANKADRFYAALAGVEPQNQTVIAPVKHRAAQNPDIAELGPDGVMAEIAEFVGSHPNVLIAWRQNSGSASYEAKSGKWAPVNFYDWIVRPEKMRLPDIMGMLLDGRLFAIEAKNRLWKKPKDDREREQAAYLMLLAKKGHRAGFAVSVDDARAIIEG